MSASSSAAAGVAVVSAAERGAAAPGPMPALESCARIALACSVAASGETQASIAVWAAADGTGVATDSPSGARYGRTTSSVRSAGAWFPIVRTMAHRTWRGSTSACECALAAAIASSAMRSRRGIYWSV